MDKSDDRPEGWFDERDAELYTEIASLGGTVVEVGTWMGRSLSYALPCVIAAGGEFWSIDLWRGTLHGARQTEEQEASHYLRFWRGMQALGFAGRFHHLRLDSVRASTLFAEGSLDAVYIDAHHAYEAVLADIDAWRPKVRPSGWIMGHDWGYAQVAQAVRERLGEPQRITGASWGFQL